MPPFMGPCAPAFSTFCREAHSSNAASVCGWESYKSATTSMPHAWPSQSKKASLLARKDLHTRHTPNPLLNLTASRDVLSWPV